MLAKLKQEAINCATEIQSIAVITMKRKLGESGKIFGTVTHKQIVEELKLKSGGKGTFEVFCFPLNFS